MEKDIFLWSDKGILQSPLSHLCIIHYLLYFIDKKVPGGTSVILFQLFMHTIILDISINKLFVPVII